MTAPLRTRDGTTIVAWGSYGAVCGYGVCSESRPVVDRDLADHREGCASQGGYSDRRIVAVDDEGYLWSLTYDDDDAERLGGWVRANGGQAARYSADDLPAPAEVSP